jgi:hypothetical protein
VTLTANIVNHAPFAGFTNSDTSIYTVGHGTGATATASVMLNLHASPNRPILTLIGIQDTAGGRKIEFSRKDGGTES